MAIGTVKWFNNAKGYGFILSEDKGDDLFIHYSSIQMDGYKSLKAGQEVEYDVQQGPKGLHAVNIRSTGAAIQAEDDAIQAEDDAIAAAGNVAATSGTTNADDLTRNPMHQVPIPAEQPASEVASGASTSQPARQIEVALD